MSTILKLQRSLNAGPSMVLGYNQAKTVNFQIENTPNIDKWFGPNDKIYVKAKISRKGNGGMSVEVQNTVRNPGW